MCHAVLDRIRKEISLAKIVFKHILELIVDQASPSSNKLEGEELSSFVDA